VKFQRTSTRGRGFKIVIVCNKCQSLCIPSYAYINIKVNQHEINRRFIFKMRVLDLGERMLKSLAE
ncbi:hypothetical protein X777_10230, partial [Ooceraea biroi]